MELKRLVEYVMYHCPRFANESGRLNDTPKGVIGLYNLVEEMLTSKVNWSVVKAIIGKPQELD